MFQRIIAFSVHNKLFVLLFVALLVGTGVYSIKKIPLDAVPDITNNQVQVVTVSPASAPQEVEKFITYPLELALGNLPDVDEIRSISRFGLSVITVVFAENVPILNARQLVTEQISIASKEIPDGLGTPELMPITTGLGEIYQYTLQVEPGYESEYNAMELRTIQDWIVKRRLTGIPGIIEVSSFGGYLKQYEVAVDPILLRSFNLSLVDVYEALHHNNENSGGSYIEKGPTAYYIRTEGLVNSINDIEDIKVGNRPNTPVFIRDIGRVGYGSAKRFGAMTKDGNGETVGGITLMYKGANSYEAVKKVKERIAEIQKTLPEGVRIEPYLDRSSLIDKAINTVSKNLIEGGLIVVFVLVLLLGDIRAGFIVASVIPLSMLFGLSCMNLFGVSANLMSLGAIDFGIVVDGAVIITEGILHVLFAQYIGKNLSKQEFDNVLIKSASSIYKSAAFGVLIILVVFIPILTLSGVEGKMFRPMAQAVSFAILGALILSSTYVPVMSSMFLNRQIKPKQTIAEKIMNRLKKVYRPALVFALKKPVIIIAIAVSTLLLSIFTFRGMGAEFTPTLEEGDLAMQMALEPGSSLKQSIAKSTEAEKILKMHFPEVLHVVSKIGTAEVPTDPMAIEDADIMIILDEKENWVSATDRFELIDMMEEKLSFVKDASFEFTQPIQLRFNELMSGAKSDIAIKIFGEDLNTLAHLANTVAEIVEPINGATDVKVEKTEGLPQLLVEYNRSQMAYYGVDINDLNTIIRSAFAGEVSGFVFEGERKFDLVVRLKKPGSENPDLSKLFIQGKTGQMVPISEMASLVKRFGPMQITRENTKRRINIGVNVRQRDIASVVSDIRSILNTKIDLPPGYYIEYGGEFEKLENASARLTLVVPIALFLIFVLLFFTFQSAKYALLIFSAVPLSAIGGVFALYLRGMPFSISAGVGFIALFGVAVLNGIVLISYYNELKRKGDFELTDLIIDGSLTRLRPVLMTALVASLGFLPMALSTSEGAEVQKPLATVVIGGLVSATLLTLLLLPVLYNLLEKRENKGQRVNKKVLASIVVLLLSMGVQGQDSWNLSKIEAHVSNNHPLLKSAELQIEITKLHKQNVWALDPINASMQYGMINYGQNDYFLQFNQDLGNIWQRIAQAKTLNKSILLNQAEMQILINSLILNSQIAYTEWYYLNSTLDLLYEFEKEILELDRIANLQMNKGEISDLDQGLIQMQLTSISILINQYQIQATQKGSRVKELSYLPQDATLDSVGFTIPIFITDSDLGKSFFAKNEAMVNEAELKIKTQKTYYAPELTLGYFNQSLERQSGFFGYYIGVNAPIWWWGNQNKVEQAKLLKEQTQLANEYEINEKQQRLSALNESFMLTETQIRNLEQQLKKAQSLSMLSKKSLEKGEISYLEYFQQQQILLNVQLSHFDLKKQQSSTLFQIQFLSK
ncbi:MAG: CusA/CzcA family heavy metal efflux RND transporter [Bacteroidia bacterium]